MRRHLGETPRKYFSVFMFSKIQRLNRCNTAIHKLTAAQKMSFWPFNSHSVLNTKVEGKHTTYSAYVPLWPRVTFFPGAFSTLLRMCLNLRCRLGSMCSSVMQIVWDGATQNSVSRRATRKSTSFSQCDSIPSRGGFGHTYCLFQFGKGGGMGGECQVINWKGLYLPNTWI